jgi:hypothetical protein
MGRMNDPAEKGNRFEGEAIAVIIKTRNYEV